MRDARNSITTYVYDTAGNLEVVADPNGNRTTFAYDALNRKTSETDPLGKLTTFAYDSVGNMTSSTDALGRKKEFTRDALDRLTTEVWRNPNNTINDTRNYQYDAASKLLQAGETTTGTYTMDYDLAGQVTRVVDPSGTTITFTYDNAGNRTVFRDSLGGIQTSVYDAVNRLTSRTQTGNGGAARVTMTYTTRDQVASVSKYASATGTTIIGSTTYTYDTTGRLTGQTDKRAAAATFLAANYVSERQRRRSQVADTP